MSVRSEVIRIFSELIGQAKKISDLPAAGSVAGADLVEVSQGGVSKKATITQVASGGSGVTSVTGDGVGGTATDPVITLKNGLPSADTTGTAIAFATPQIYGTPGSPESGNITLVTTGLVKGMVQILYHDNGTEPTYPAEFVKLSGTYSTTVLNIIYMHAISAARIEYTISQQA